MPASVHHRVDVSGPFVRAHLVPSFVGLTSTEWHILAALVSYDHATKAGVDQRKGFVYPRDDRLSRELGTSEATIKRGLRRLEELAYILRARHRVGRSSRSIRLIYINHARCARGHKLILDERVRSNAALIPQLREEFFRQLREDDHRFLDRLLSDGAIHWEDLAVRARKAPSSVMAQIIREHVAWANSSPMSPTCEGRGGN